MGRFNIEMTIGVKMTQFQNVPKSCLLLLFFFVVLFTFYYYSNKKLLQNKIFTFQYHFFTFLY